MRLRNEREDGQNLPWNSAYHSAKLSRVPHPPDSFSPREADRKRQESLGICFPPAAVFHVKHS